MVDSAFLTQNPLRGSKRSVRHRARTELIWVSGNVSLSVDNAWLRPDYHSLRAVFTSRLRRMIWTCHVASLPGEGTIVVARLPDRRTS
jgi:hypothetical protein